MLSGELKRKQVKKLKMNKECRFAIARNTSFAWKFFEKKVRTFSNCYNKVEIKRSNDVFK